MSYLPMFVSLSNLFFLHSGKETVVMEECYMLVSCTVSPGNTIFILTIYDYSIMEKVENRIDLMILSEIRIPKIAM